uniref:Ubiquitin-like protease family profile domain-containing protein n=1 Tax=Setaria italica TaxID=4555 RepID=K3ZV78_SETIT
MLSHVQGANNEDEQPMLSPIQEALNEDDGTSALEGDERVDDLEVNDPTRFHQHLHLPRGQQYLDYEQGKPFLYWSDLLEGSWELHKLHGWIMNAMKQGIQEITAHVPTKVFLGILPYQIVINFEGWHRLYHRQHLDMNLILMQWSEEELTHGRFKVAYLDPSRISEPEHKLKMTETIKAQIEAAATQAEEDAIKIKAHREEMHKVSVYIAKVMNKKASKDYIMIPYGFEDHWICIIILPKLGEAVVLDSASYHRDSATSNLPALFYVVLHATIDSNYSKIKDKQIDNIYTNMARFILCKICHEDGAFFDKDGVLMANECTNLRRWA